ncbi:MAG: AbrB/MazE/SpoVT family DNA-binding domain-containing protein [Spirochaetales bacterium]|nr:AbrB/MazE/SpoVT family DNA-binding domain-containing protein [Spirochaetales bacterium]
MITTVTGKNQVTIPAELARQEAMRPGTRLDWRATSRPHVLEVTVLPDPASLASSLRGRGERARRQPGSPVDRLVQQRQEQDRDRTGQ